MTIRDKNARKIAKRAKKIRDNQAKARGARCELNKQAKLHPRKRLADFVRPPEVVIPKSQPLEGIQTINPTF